MKRLVIPVLMLLLLTGCVEDDLKKVAKSLVITSQAVTMVYDSAIEAHQLKLISTEELVAIRTVCKSVALAGKDAVKITRDFSKLGEYEKSKLLNILRPIIEVVRSSQLTLQIKDPDTKEKIRILLLAVETGLNTTQVILAASGGN